MRIYGLGQAGGGKMTAFVLSVFDEEESVVHTIIMTNSREKALRSLGSRELDLNDGRITPPTKGVDENILNHCKSRPDETHLIEVPIACF